MKNTISLILAAILLLSLAACDGTAETETTAAPAEMAAATEAALETAEAVGWTAL